MPCFVDEPWLCLQNLAIKGKRAKGLLMGGGTGRDVFEPGFKNCLYGRRDGMFARTARF